MVTEFFCANCPVARATGSIAQQQYCTTTTTTTTSSSSSSSSSSISAQQQLVRRQPVGELATVCTSQWCSARTAIVVPRTYYCTATSYSFSSYSLQQQYCGTASRLQGYHQQLLPPTATTTTTHYQLLSDCYFEVGVLPLVVLVLAARPLPTPPVLLLLLLLLQYYYAQGEPPSSQRATTKTMVILLAACLCVRSKKKKVEEVASTTGYRGTGMDKNLTPPPPTFFLSDVAWLNYAFNKQGNDPSCSDRSCNHARSLASTRCLSPYSSESMAN